MAFKHIYYAGLWRAQNLALRPNSGVIHCVTENGDLLWYRYTGNGEGGSPGNLGWDPNSGNKIGVDWRNFRHIVGGGDGVIVGIHQNGDLLWYKYTGKGEGGSPGNLGWDPNSGNKIGVDWRNFRHVFVNPREGRLDSLVIHCVTENGDLLWYRYTGNGEGGSPGNLGWDPNSGNKIGVDWRNFRHIVGGGDGVIVGIHQNGDLLWYKYTGKGEGGSPGNLGWDPNSGNKIGQGWQNFRTIFGGMTTMRFALFPVTQNGDLLWYGYTGSGDDSTPGGGPDWHSNSGNKIGEGW